MTARVTHIRRVFDDGVISSTDYTSSQDAIDAGVFSAMGAQETGKTFTDENTGNTAASTGSTYLDIEVTDQHTITDGSGFTWQQTVRTFLWGDSWASNDPSWSSEELSSAASRILSDLAGSSAISSDRKMVTKIILLDPSDTNSGVPVPIIAAFRIASGSGFTFQETVYSLNNSTTGNRKQIPKRIINVSKDDNGNSQTDDSQFIDMMVIDGLTRTSSSGFTWQGAVMSIDNSDYYNLLNVTDPPDDATIGDSGVDPPWMIDPLQRIVNVAKGAQYRLVMFRQGLRGGPQASISFTTPKTFFSSSEVKKGIPAPIFGGDITVPTDTNSGNGSFSRPSYNPTVPDPPGGPFTGPPVTTTIGGDALEVVQAVGAPDYRGYTTLAVIEFEEAEDQDAVVPVPTGDFIYFNYKGERVDKIPPLTRTEINRGLPLASDQDGTVYVKSFATYKGGPKFAQEGITKYDKNGNILWAENPTPELGPFAVARVWSANYDPSTKLITFVLTDGTINVWSMGGDEVSVTPLDPAYSIHSVSRKGRRFAFHFGEKSGQEDALAAFSPTGKKLWEIPFGDFKIIVATPFGEDWLVTTEVGNKAGSVEQTFEAVIPDDPPLDDPPGPGWKLVGVSDTTSEDFQIGIYNAKTGSRVSSEFWASNATSTSYIFSYFPDSSVLSGQSIVFNQDSYASLFFNCSAYFP